MSIEKRYYGTLKDGRVADVYTLRNKNGMQVDITNFGGTILRIITPDVKGRMSNVVLCYDGLCDYEATGGSLGITVGRFANRIAEGKFTLDGKVYDGLYLNNNGNHLHGGKEGFSAKLWDVLAADDSDEPSLVIHYTSPDGEEGYPGTLDTTVTFTLDSENALSIVYSATTDKPTIINLTNHSYFNLGGCASGTIFDHELWMDAESYLEVRKGLIPTGKILPVDGTPFDFRTPKTIGRDFYADDEALRLAGGYDHCMVHTGWMEQTPDSIPLRAIAKHPVTGRVMKMYTNQPATHLYTANFLNKSEPLEGGLPQKTQIAFCLETEAMPDSPNHEGFTNCVLRPGETYSHITVFEFSVEA